MQTPTHRKRALILGITLGIVFVSCLIFIFLFPSTQIDDGLTALIYQDGKLIQTIPLYSVSETYELTVSDDDGNYNLIEVRPGANSSNGSIGITGASCPDKLCVHMGFQETSLLPITCLPNKLVIRLVSGADSPDATTGLGNGASQDSDLGLDGITY